MEISELRRISAKEGLSLNFAAKDEVISKALFELQGNDDIILKGGTAISRIYARNKRFSEDIDFDIIFKGTIKEALLRTNEIISKITVLAASKPRIMKNTIRYDLAYTNPLGHKDKIRIEFNIVKTASNYEKKIVNYGFVPHDTALLNVYNLEKILCQKIDCIFNRVDGKDFFDLKQLIELSTKQPALKQKKQELLKQISIAEKQIPAIANTLNHYIPREQRPDWAMFLEELKEKIKNIS